MIGSLQGKLVRKQPPSLLIEVGGVGYVVSAPLSTCYDLPEVGAEVHLLTELQVRDDALELYGFRREDERDLFLALIKISGIGAKLALTVLSGTTVEQFSRLVIDGDSTALTKLPGVGKKTAERIVLELRDKLAIDGAKELSSSFSRPAASSPHAEAQEALRSLGYRPAEIERLLENAPDEADAEQLIRQALVKTIAR